MTNPSLFTPQPDATGPTAYRRAPLSVPDPWQSVHAAGFGIRAFARMIDFVVRLAAQMGGGLVFWATYRLAQPGCAAFVEVPAVSTIAPRVMGLVGMLLYHGISESLGGASVGKIICGLRVTTPSLGRASLGSAIVRNLAFFVDVILLGAVAWFAMRDSPRRLRYGDRWSGTVVVLVEDSPNLVRGTPEALALWALVGLSIEAALSFVLCALTLRGV